MVFVLALVAGAWGSLLVWYEEDLLQPRAGAVFRQGLVRFLPLSRQANLIAELEPGRAPRVQVRSAAHYRHWVANMPTPNT